MTAAVPFSVHVPGDAEGLFALVLGVSFPYLLVGPDGHSPAPRWVLADECTFGRVYFDRPWHAEFTSPAQHGHEGDA